MSRPSILIAEDNVAFAKAEAFNLRPLGYDVTVAYDGLEACEYANQIQFDLLLTDYDLPGIKGTDLCRRLRADDRYSQTPIILMTCFSRDLNTVRLEEELKLSAILSKPFRSSELLNTIKQCLGEEEADLAEILDSVEALETSIQSALSRVSCGQKVRVTNGLLEGVRGTVIARRSGERILLRMANGGFVEICEHSVS